MRTDSQTIASSMRVSTSFRWVAGATTAAFVWTMALSALPALHERIHANQGRTDHSCAVTFMRSGNCHHSTAPTVTGVADATQKFAAVPELSTRWIAALFLGAAIFEHAPPSFS